MSMKVAGWGEQVWPRAVRAGRKARWFPRVNGQLIALSGHSRRARLAMTTLNEEFMNAVEPKSSQ